MEHKLITGIGGTVHYWISRPEAVKKPMTIVFTHGLTADHTMFEKQVAYFKDNYNVITWDVPLHGLSRPYAPFTYENTAIDLHKILENESLDKVLLVGMSMGGYPSQMFAKIYPDQVLGFVGIDTTPFGKKYYSKSDLWWLKQVAPLAKWFSDNLLRKSMAKSVSVTAYSYEKMIEMLKPFSKEEIIEQMDVAYGKFAGENQDIELHCPVLILLGEKDRTGKVSSYCKTWAKNTGYPLHIIRNAAHFSNGDNAEQVNEEIEGMLMQIK